MRADLSEGQRATLRKEARKVAGRPGEHRRTPLPETPPVECAADKASERTIGLTGARTVRPEQEPREG